MPCELSRKQVNLVVVRSIRRATGVPVTAQSSLWFELGLPRAARNLLYYPIRDGVGEAGCTLSPVDLSEANSVGDVQELVWGAL
jgi:hypothetical protein